MRTLVLLSLSLAVALAMPPFPPGVAQNPALPKDEQSPLLGDLVPAQGHVEVENPAPQPRMGSQEPQGKSSVVVEQSESRNMVELEVKVKPRAEVQQEGGVKAEVKVEQEEKENPEVKVEKELKAEPEVKVEPEVNLVNLNPGVMDEPEFNMKPEAEMEPELHADPDVKAESEVKVEPELEEDPMFNAVQEEIQVQMNLEPEPETGLEVVERHIDMERNYKMEDEPIMELEPLDDGDKFEEEGSDKELSEVEKSMRAAFLGQDPLPEEEGLMRKRDYVLDEEPIMELEPETRKEAGPDTMEEGGEFEEEGSDKELSEVEKSMRAAFLGQDPLPEEEGLMRKRDYVLDGEPIMELEPETRKEAGPAIMEEGPALDIMGQEMSSLESYFPNEEARMGMELQKQQDSLTQEGSHFSMMQEPGTGAEEVGFEEPAVKDSPVVDGGALMRQGEQRCCPGVELEGKRYQFFRGPLRATDAEFFCQAQFPGGHLASITSRHIHNALMAMMLRQNGDYTRTWIGGIRYLETGRFIWLDGSHFSYADWLSGEPNNTADVEDCLEVLRNGKFNDFTCWEPQAFICSYSYP